MLAIDLPAFIVAALSGLCGGMVGSLLLLKKQTMMADALSHSVLPGLALAYIVTETMGAIALFSGALLSCVAAALIIALIQKKSSLNANMAMGITLTAMFAFGVILLELYIGGRVHLDTEHALYGALELIYWPEPGNLATMPSQITTLIFISLALGATIYFTFPLLRLVLFDGLYARTLGLSESAVTILILFMTVLVTVACFDAVGSILVLSLFVCPAACARMVCDRLRSQIIAAAIIGALCGITGYYIGAILPISLGFENSVSAAGAIALTCGLTQILFILFAPEYGIFVKSSKNTKKPEIQPL